MTDITTIILDDLPKISLNKFYAGMHWKKRSNMKNTFHLLLNKYSNKFKKDKRYAVNYSFEFRIKPLDASNCIGMIKLIEDVIFEDDKFDIVTSLLIQSKKGNSDRVTIEVIEF